MHIIKKTMIAYDKKKVDVQVEGDSKRLVRLGLKPAILHCLPTTIGKNETLEAPTGVRNRQAFPNAPPPLWGQKVPESKRTLPLMKASSHMLP